MSSCVYVVRNETTGQYVTHGNGRIAVYWNQKMAQRTANAESKRVFMAYTGREFREPTTFKHVVVELDPDLGFEVE